MRGAHDPSTTGGGLEPVALSLLQDHGPEIMRTARRYAANREDAEDAFQRGFEILLTRAPPDVGEADLVPWLKTVVKHEAYALHRARERQASATDDGALVEHETPAAAPHEAAESRERGLQGAEALARLKPQQLRALMLKARGLSYHEIGDLQGWSYTKVNRLLTEGRRAFRRRLAGIQTGVECERMEPLLSLLADGEANAEQLGALRPHLKTCLSCRARLREFRATPQDVAALVPASGGDGGRLRTLVEGLLGIAQGKAALLSERAHALTEMATGQKLAAVAASAVAVAGGGAAVKETATSAAPAPTPVVQERDRAPEPAPPAAAEQEPVETTPAPYGTSSTPSASTSAPAPDQPEPKPAPDPATEFDPSAAAAAPAAPVGSSPRSVPESGAPSLGAAAPGTGPPAAAAPAGAAPVGAGGPAPSSPPGTSEFAP